MNQFDLKPEKRPMMSSLRPILFSLLILISGIIIGAGLTLIATGKTDPQATLPPGPEYMSNRMVNRIVHELELSPQQREQLEPIVQKHMKAMDELRREFRPKITEEIKQMNEEIASILDDKQKEIWQDKIKKIQEHFKQMRMRRRPGNGPRGNRDNRFQPGQDPTHPNGRLHDHPPMDPLPPGETPPHEDNPPPPNEF